MNSKLLTTVYCSPVNWGLGIPYWISSQLCLGTPSCLGLIWFGTVARADISSCLVKLGYEATLSVSGKGPSLSWVRVFHVKVDDNESMSDSLTQDGTYPFHTPNGLATSDSVPWVVVVVIQSTVQWHLWAEDIYPSAKCMHDPVNIHFHYTLPEVFTHPWWMLWWTSIGEVITSHWSTPGKSWWPDVGWLPDHYPLMA